MNGNPPLTHLHWAGPAGTAVAATSTSPPATPFVLPPQPVSRRRLVLTVLAIVVFVAAVLLGGLDGLIPFGLLLAFSTASGEAETRRAVILTPRNLLLASAMVVAFGWFWLWHLDETASTLVVIAGVLMALPLALQESETDAARYRTVAVTKRSVIMGLLALVIFVNVYYAFGQGLMALVAVCVVVPVSLAASRLWGVRQGRTELGLLRHPLRRELRPHLMQAFNIWLFAGLIAAVLAAGGAHAGRILFSLNVAQFDVMIAVFVAGLLVLAALAMVPRQRVYVTTNVAVALISGVLAFQLLQMSVSPTNAVVLDPPLAGEWYVTGASRSVLLNGHSPNELNAVDFRRLGANGRTHTGGSDASLAEYAGFGMPVLAPANGQIVGVADGHADTPPGTNGDQANHVVVDIGDGRYVVLAHLKQGSARVLVGDVVRRGQPLATVGNSGHTNEPHLHMQVQDSPSGNTDADRTYPMLFHNVDITRGGAWPWDDSRELRPGDLVEALAQ